MLTVKTGVFDMIVYKEKKMYVGIMTGRVCCCWT